MRLLALFATAIALTAADAQTPPARLQVEITEEARAVADACRLDFRLEARDPDPAVAVEATAAEWVRVRDGVAALKLEGVTLTPTPLVLTRTEQVVGRGVPGEVSYLASRPVRVTVVAADFDTLTARVSRAETELFALGVKGFTNGVAGRTAYYRRDGWEDARSAAVVRAAKRGQVKAEALAAAAGVKLGPVADLAPVTYIAPSDPTFPVTDQLEAGEDGVLTLRVRVRLSYHIVK